MLLKRFDVDDTCPGFPVDDRLKFIQERCCIVLLVEHVLKQVRVVTDGVRKVMLELKQEGPGSEFADQGDFQSIASISWPFDSMSYFAAKPASRSALLAQACEAALIALAKRRGWSQSAIREVFAKVRAAEFRLQADRSKACRSPDGERRARVSYYVDREEFRVDVMVSGPKKAILLRRTLYRDRPTSGLCVHFTLGKPFWASNRKLIVPIKFSGIPKDQIAVKCP